MASTDVTFKLLGDATSAVRSFGRAGDAGSKLSGKMRGLAGSMVAMAGIGGIGALAKGAFDLAQDLGQLQTKSETVFGDSLGGVEAWADTVKRRFGASSSEVVGMATSMADLLKPMGFTTEAAADMSQETVGLSGALADWSQGQYNAAEVSDILAKAMLGERDQLKSLGIAISQAEVDQRAMALATADGRDEITQMDRALATQELIFEKSGDAQAAYADGGNKLVNAQNTIKSVFKDLRDMIVLKLIPAFGAAIDVGTSMIRWARDNKDILLAVGAAIAVVAGAQGLIMLVNGLKAARATMFGLNAVMALNPMMLVGIAIAALVAGLVILYNRSETFRSMVQTLWDWLKKLGSTLADVGVVILGALKTAFEKIKPIIEAHLKVLTGLIEFVKSVFTGDWQGAWDAVKKIAAGVFDGIKALFGLLLDGLLEILGLGAAALAAAGPKLWSWIVDGFVALPGLALSAWVGFHRWLYSRIAATAKALKAGGSKLWDWIVDGIKGLPGALVDAATGFGTALWDLGVDLIKGIIEGIGSMAGKVGDAVSSVIPGPIKSAAGWLGGKIPEFADGGVAEPNSPFLALLGDNTREPEIVSPVSTMQAALADVLATTGGTGAPGADTFILELDGHVLGQVVVDRLARESRLRGSTLVGGLT
ncbi:MAG: hypothetical protein GY925_29625 [Actinomycetia bacterium]|nr:hypothetical protein [Actinomycetes bacterium]